MLPLGQHVLSHTFMSTRFNVSSLENNTFGINLKEYYNIGLTSQQLLEIHAFRLGISDFIKYCELKGYVVEIIAKNSLLNPCSR